MAISGFTGSAQASQASILQAQIADQKKAQAIMKATQQGAPIPSWAKPAPSAQSEGSSLAGFGGFGGFNQANQALALYEQVNGKARFDVDMVDARGQRYETFADVGRAFRVSADEANYLKGFGVDTNQDGKADAFLALDIDKDGKHDIAATNRMIKAFGGNEDFNGDNVVSDQERAEARALAAHARQIDLDRDGVLEGWELQRAGARVIKETAPADAPIRETINLPGFEETARPTPGYQHPFNPYQNPGFSPYFNSSMMQMMSFINQMMMMMFMSSQMGYR